MSRRSDRVQTAVRIAAWACLLGIAFITLGPIGFRPESGLSPSIERFAAFAVVGALFAVAYPRYILIAAAIVLGAAVLFEVLQLLSPSRHGRAFDASVKIAGGVFGLAAGWLLAKSVSRR
jgi:apolipoprotein N-acyltransferase